MHVAVGEHDSAIPHSIDFESRRDPAQLAVGFQRYGKLVDRVETSMAADGRASLVDLRAGAILFVLAAPHFAFASPLDAARHYFGGVGRNRISNRVRNFFGADDRALGLAIWQS